MHTIDVRAGKTDVTVYVKFIDSTAGTPETGVTFETVGIDLWYMREGADHVALTEATQTVAGAHADGGVVHISDGIVRVDLPDAACASGVNHVYVGGTATGMIVIGCAINLVAYDPFDTVRMGMTALPNAAADAAGGLPISDDGGLDMDAILEDTNALQGDLVNGGRLDLIFDAIQTDTEDLQTQIGTDGAGLTALPWNAAWDEQVQSEVTDSLVAHNLDHLALTATVAADMTAEVANNTILSRIIANGVTLNFDPSTDGLQPIKDSLATSADIADAVLDEQMAGHVDAGSAGKAIGDILVDTGTTIPGTITVIDNEIATIDTNVDSILADTQTDGVVVATASKTGYTLAATTGLGNQTANITGNLTGSVGSVTGAVGSVTTAVTLTAAGIDAIWDEPMQTGLSGRNALRALMAFVAGKTSGAATTSITFRDVGDTINMIVQTVDSEGDRSATTLTFA